MAEPVLHKAVACVVRGEPPHEELLVFDHPSAGTQIPKGTMEPGEEVVAAALRELLEESGVSDAEPVRLLGSWTRRLAAGRREPGVPARHDWHMVLLRPTRALPETWSHVAVGSPEEEGLVFAYRWVPVDAALASRLHPLFAEVAALVVRGGR